MIAGTQDALIRLHVALLVSILLLPAGNALAEPYLAVFKGMQCSNCHSHPSGGGKRNVYGNVFAQSELPARRAGSEAAELWTGEVLKWLSVGGNLRADYQYTDTPNQASVTEFDVTRGTVYVEVNLIPNLLSLYLD